MENNENETNEERLNNNFQLLDVTSEKFSISDFMLCSFENHTFFEDQLPNLTNNLCSSHYPHSIDSHI